MPYELAGALYAQALAELARRQALLHEAAVLIDGLASELKPLHDVRRLREAVDKALRGAG